MQRTLNTLLLLLTAAATGYAGWLLLTAWPSTRATIMAGIIAVFVAVSWSGRSSPVSAQRLARRAGSVRLAAGG